MIHFVKLFIVYEHMKYNLPTKILKFINVVNIKIFHEEILLISISKCRTIHEGNIRNRYNYNNYNSVVK